VPTMAAEAQGVVRQGRAAGQSRRRARSGSRRRRERPPSRMAASEMVRRRMGSWEGETGRLVGGRGQRWGIGD
jgi:hypothetical protein